MPPNSGLLCSAILPRFTTRKRRSLPSGAALRTGQLPYPLTLPCPSLRPTEGKFPKTGPTPPVTNCTYHLWIRPTPAPAVPSAARRGEAAAEQPTGSHRRRQPPPSTEHRAPRPRPPCPTHDRRASARPRPATRAARGSQPMGTQLCSRRRPMGEREKRGLRPQTGKEAGSGVYRGALCAWASGGDYSSHRALRWVGAAGHVGGCSPGGAAPGRLARGAVGGQRRQRRWAPWRRRRSGRTSWCASICCSAASPPP